MKISIITNELWPDTGGVGRYVDLLAKGLVEHGAELEVVTHKGHASHQFSGYKVQPRLYRSFINPLLVLRNIFFLRKYMAKNKIDTSYIFACYGSLLLGLLSLPRGKTSYIVIFHGSEFLRCNSISEKSKIFRYLFTRFLAKSIKVVCISRFVKGLVDRSNFGYRLKDKIEVVYNSVNGFSVNSIDECSRKEKSKIKKEECLNLLSVGRLDHRKRIDLLIRAIKLAKREIRLHIVGSGITSGALVKLTEELSLSDKVIFYGRISDEELNNQYLIADVCVVCAGRHNFTVEGFGLTIVEAAARGLKVLAFDVDGAGEVAREIGAAIVQPEINSIARYLDQFGEETLSKQMGREEVMARFSVVSQANKFLELLES